MTTPSNTSPTYTWQGKGLRLIDLMDNEERKAVLGAFPSERQFRSMHVTGDAMEGKPSLRTAAELKVVANQMVQTAAYLEKQAPVRQLPLNQVLVDGFDLAATIGNDLVNHHAAYERAQNRPQSKEVGASNGLG